MSLENLHCPQFVDFTVPESFDINDGADFFFEKGVVGEFDAQIEMDLGTFGGSQVPTDPVEEITEKISNLNKKSLTPEKPDILKENQHATRAAAPLQSKQENPKNPPRPVTRKSLRDAQADKENMQAKAERPVKEVASIKLDSAINCAMDMIMASHAKQTPTCSGTPPRPDSLEKTEEAEERSATTPVYSEATVTPELPKNETKTSGSALTKPTAASLNKQKQTLLSGAGAAGVNPSIVKKTLAKMTAAFKPNRPVVVLDREALKGKRMNFSGKKAATVCTAEARSGRANTPSSRGTPGRLNSSQDFTKHKDNVTRLSRPMSPEAASSSRRCSSVPRTLRERQALSSSSATAADTGAKSTKTNTFGKKIQNFFNNSNKTKQTQSKTKALVSDPKDRRRSRSVNESIQTATKPHTGPATPTTHRPSSQQTNDSLTTNKANKSSYTKITASPSFSKPRQKSAERTLQVPLPQGVTSFYTGVKFVSNNHSQLSIKKKLVGDHALPAFQANTNNSSVLTSHLGSLPVNELLKNRPVCLGSKPKPPMNTSVTKPTSHYMRTTPGKSASFRATTATAGGNTSLSRPHPKSNVSDQALNVSVDKTAGRVRKVSESNSSMNAGGGLLRTELRAMKRSEYEQQLKDKEKMAAIIKHELDQEKLRKQQEEIQKIRNQRNFRSNPIKHYKPVTLKPSDKSLTEPKSPNLSTSTARLNELSRLELNSNNYNTTHRLSMALVDAPLVKRPIVKSHQCAGGIGEEERMTTKTRTVSSDDLRF